MIDFVVLIAGVFYLAVHYATGASGVRSPAGATTDERTADKS
jgi:hypothetical protein